jgi:hypothetical protein
MAVRYTRYTRRAAPRTRPAAMTFSINCWNTHAIACLQPISRSGYGPCRFWRVDHLNEPFGSLDARAGRSVRRLGGIVRGGAHLRLGVRDKTKYVGGSLSCRWGSPKIGEDRARFAVCFLGLAHWSCSSAIVVLVARLRSRHAVDAKAGQSRQQSQSHFQIH